MVGPDDLSKEMKNMIAFDLPGRYPITSADGYKYIFIMYDLDSENIKPIAMKSRETDEMIRCYEEGYTFFKQAGFIAELVRMDNELSKRLI